MVSSVRKYIFLFSISLLFFTKIIESISIEHRNSETEFFSRHEREDTETLKKIKIHVKDGTVTKTFELSKLENNHIANENLKIWTIHTNGWVSDKSSINNYKNGISEIGSWVMYQNAQDKSAVTYFPKHNLLSGIVGKNYHISFSFYNGSGDFHFEVNSDNRSAGRKKREINDNFEQFLNSSYIKNKFKRSIEDNSNKPIPSFYLESLVFISGQKIDSLPSGFKDVGDQSCEHYVMHVLSFFNIIDMLAITPYVFINIAGIVVRKNGEIIPFLENQINQGKIMLRAANIDFQNFMLNKQMSFDRISFDYVIILTDHPLFYEKTSQTMNSSLAYPKQGIYELKKSKSFYPNPTIFAPNNLTLSSIKFAASKIFEMIGGFNYVKNYKTSDNDSFVLINDFQKLCLLDPEDRCFKWHKDYCNFVNKPASLQKTHKILMTINDQCWCHDYDYYYEEKTNETVGNICLNGFECKLKNVPVLNVTFVMNGMACGDKKACWDGTCETV